MAQRYPPGLAAPSYGALPQQGNSIAQLILQQGQNQAQSAARSGELWGNTLATVGAQIGQGLQARSAQKAEEKKKAALNAQDNAYMARISDTTQPPITPAETLRIYGPERGPAIHKAYASLQSDKPDLDTVLAGFEASTPELRAQAWPTARQHLLRAGSPEEFIPQQYDDQWYQRFKLAKSGAKPREPYTLAENAERRGPNDELLARNVPAPKEERLETRGIDVQAAEALAKGDTATYQRLLKVKKEMGQADDRPRINVQMPSGMSPTMEANVVNRLSGQWRTSVAPIVELDRQVKLLDEGLKAARSGNLEAGAQTVLVTFQKILDPPSVVRESEYNRGPEGLALMDRVRGAYERLLKGGAGIPADQLEKFADLARAAAKAQASGYSQSVKERLGKTADRYQIPRELVFEDFEFNFDRPGSAPSATAGGTPPRKVTSKAEFDALPSGTPFIDPKGIERVKP